MTLPLVRNDSAAARGLTIWHMAIAIAAAWLLPVVIGGLFYGIEAALSQLRPEGPPNLLFGVGFVLIMVPMFSWAGLVPGAVLLWYMARAGWGGLVPVVAAGFGFGWLIGALVGGVSTLSIFSLSGMALAAVAWVALKLVRPAALVSPR